MKEGSGKTSLWAADWMCFWIQAAAADGSGKLFGFDEWQRGVDAVNGWAISQALRLFLNIMKYHDVAIWLADIHQHRQCSRVSRKLFFAFKIEGCWWPKFSNLTPLYQSFSTVQDIFNMSVKLIYLNAKLCRWPIWYCGCVTWSSHVG